MKTIIAMLIGALGMTTFHYWLDLPVWLTLIIAGALSVVITPAAGDAIEGRVKRRQIRK